MFDSKFGTVMIVLTFAFVCAAVVFQLLEMQEYELFSTLMAAK